MFLRHISFHLQVLDLLGDIIIFKQRGYFLIVNENYHNKYLKVNILNNKYLHIV